MPDRKPFLPPRYQDVEHVAHGGMGDVHRATDTELGRTVAIKVLADRYADDQGIRRRFTHEAQAAARISGEPNTVTIFDVGEWEGRPYIVMEFLEGGTLQNLLKTRGAQAPSDVLRWLGETAVALDAAHQAGIVHRDVKPGNLLLDNRGEVRVADFGVASAVGLDSMTMTGTVLGTAGYLSPEQAKGERATPASDRYALGVVAFELLTGERPYAADSPTAEAVSHVHAPIPSLSDRSDLPHELDPVLRRALAKDPAARYPSSVDFVAALRDALSTAAGTTRQLVAVEEEYMPAPAPPPPRGPSRLVWVGALLLGLLALGAGLGIASVLGGDGDPKTVVTTEKGQIKTVTREVTTPTTPTTATTEAEPPPPPPPPPPSTASTGTVSSSEPAKLNDQGFALMNDGRYEEALPLLERAVGGLRGTGGLPEAYASYNLAYTRLQLGRCDEVVELLDRSQSLQKPRPEITRARERAEEQCA